MSEVPVYGRPQASPVPLSVVTNAALYQVQGPARDLQALVKMLQGYLAQKETPPPP